jgi:hypothetical protein
MSNPYVPAFPTYEENNTLLPGMSLRDYFAAQALAGFLSGVAGSDDMAELYEPETEPRVLHEHAEAVAQTMYTYAMLKERDK